MTNGRKTITKRNEIIKSVFVVFKLPLNEEGIFDNLKLEFDFISDDVTVDVILSESNLIILLRRLKIVLMIKAYATMIMAADMTNPKHNIAYVAMRKEESMYLSEMKQSTPVTLFSNCILWLPFNINIGIENMMETSIAYEIIHLALLVVICRVNGRHILLYLSIAINTRTAIEIVSNTI